MTTGQWMLYGGIGMIGAGILALCLFSRQRRKLERRIKEDYI